MLENLRSDAVYIHRSLPAVALLTPWLLHGSARFCDTSLSTWGLWYCLQWSAPSVQVLACILWLPCLNCLNMAMGLAQTQCMLFTRVLYTAMAQRMTCSMVSFSRLPTVLVTMISPTILVWWKLARLNILISWSLFHVYTLIFMLDCPAVHFVHPPSNLPCPKDPLSSGESLVTATKQQWGFLLHSLKSAFLVPMKLPRFGSFWEVLRNGNPWQHYPLMWYLMVACSHPGDLSEINDTLSCTLTNR